ncbi:MAG: nuclear transport factor 2 family protein [bacterium]|nr:nuclear transport factor 2 family protein [bacterium]
MIKSKVLSVAVIVIIAMLTLFPVMLTAGPGETDPVQLKKDRETLTHLKTVLWPKAYREQDTKLLDRILAKEFQMIDDSGVTTKKADELDYIKKNKPSHDSFKYTIKRLDIFENGTAVVSGTGLVKGKNKKGPYVLNYHSSNVLIKRDGRWQAISSHVSGVKMEQGKD